MNRIEETARTQVGRWTQLLVGLLAYGASVALMIRSELGLGPWDAFHVGLSRLTGISIGTATILVGVAIVVGTTLRGLWPGPGTLANMLLIGVFVDLLLPWTPVAPGPAWALGYYLAGIALTGVATGMYIGAGLGKGPRDGLMLGLSQHTGWPVGRVRMLIEVAVLAMGWAMGAAIGLGTVLFTALIGPATQQGLQLFRALPAPTPARSAERHGRIR